MYGKEWIKAHIPAEAGELFLYGEIDSTNSEARRRAMDGSGAAVFLADRQSAGRGRMGRSFYSPGGSGIYLSLLLPLDGNPEDILLMTSAAAVAVRRAIFSATGRETGIKWVNDLYYREKKVCGILCEAVRTAERFYVIIGVGINLYTEVFPDELASVAGSLGVCGEDKRGELAALCISELYKIWNNISDSSFIEEYRRYSTVLGKEITYTENGVTYEGVAESIDERGRLYVRNDRGGVHILASGEISIRTKNASSVAEGDVLDTPK